jgi:hypothetical protein
MRIISTVKRTDCFSGRTSYILQKGCWRDIALNIHASTEYKTDDLKDSFCEELEYVFGTFPKYHMQILLGDFNENVLKPRIWNENLYEISNDNGFRVGNFATSTNLTVKSSMFPNHKIIIHLDIF